MTAGEDQPQPLVGDLVHLVHAERLQGREHLDLLPAAAVASEAVDRPVTRGRDDPGAGVGRDALGRPTLQRDREGVLDGLLRDVEAAGDPDERGDRASRLASERAIDRGTEVLVYCGASNSITARPSIFPLNAPGHFAGASRASSRFAT